MLIEPKGTEESNEPILVTPLAARQYDKHDDFGKLVLWAGHNKYDHTSLKRLTKRDVNMIFLNVIKTVVCGRWKSGVTIIVYTPFCERLNNAWNILPKRRITLFLLHFTSSLNLRQSQIGVKKTSYIWYGTGLRYFKSRQKLSFYWV